MRDIWMLTNSDETWVMSYKWAELMGCSYPGEPAGMSMRKLLEVGPAVEPHLVRDSIKATVRQCDACFGGCTVKERYRPTTISNNAVQVNKVSTDLAGVIETDGDMIHDIDDLIAQDQAGTSTYNTSPWADTICGRCNLLLRKRNFMTGEIKVFVANHTHYIGKVINMGANSEDAAAWRGAQGPAA